ncbi:hypothetical protein [Paraburkholderia susongensis]|nr:hypothetical protein [Paraburkholderia susongensis]
MLPMIAVDLLVRVGSELHCFSDVTEDELNTVAEEAKRMGKPVGQKTAPDVNPGFWRP